jgi:Flp pilus assembly protein TadB
VLGVLVLEFLFTGARRLEKRSFAGDRLHTYDLVARRLGSRATSTFLFWALALGCAALGLTVARLPLQVGASVVALAAAAVGAWTARWWSRHRRALREEPPGD